MSILGYSSSYFLPQYWANTPLYGEKIIPLLDYILSTDYSNADVLATAFYNIESKYTNSTDLPIEVIEEIIEESGYGYVRNLLGDDEDSLKLLVYTLVMVHQLKGSRRGIETVLNMLRSKEDDLEISVVGSPVINLQREASEFTVNDFISYINFNVGDNPFEINFEIITGDSFGEEQCIASCSNYGFYLGIDTDGRVVFSVGQQLQGMRGWQVIDGSTRLVSRRTLNKNTKYYIKLNYSGYDYTVQVSLNGETYYYYIMAESDIPMSVYTGVIFIGIDKSTGILRYPFKGIISLAPFSVSSNNVKLTQWFEKFPVGDENTFEVDAEVDVGLVSSDFFTNFALFVERYVYPTLAAFKAKITLKAKIVFLPYMRQRVTYVMSNTDFNKEYFMAQDDNYSGSDDGVPFKVKELEYSDEDYQYMTVQASEVQTTEEDTGN